MPGPYPAGLNALVAVGFAWVVLFFVFVDEVAVAVALGVWGADAAGWWLAMLAPVVVVAVWWTFASPKAPYGGRVVRPVVKVAVFALGSLGLWAAGHPAWAVALLVFSVVVNALAQIPSIRDLAATTTGATSRG